MKTYRFNVRVDGIIEVKAQTEDKAWENIPHVFSSYFGDFEALSIQVDSVEVKSGSDTDSDSEKE